MPNPNQYLHVQVNALQTFQRIDGFGVNINAKSWEPRLLPAMDWLVQDLGATLFRVDIFGKSNWIDSENVLGPASLASENLARIYTGKIAQRGWGLTRYLAEHGCEPYLTTSGIVPAWMCAADRNTLIDFDHFTDMLVSLVEWAIRREGLPLRYFSPLNETDLGDPEGPLVSPAGCAEILEMLDRKLAQKNLDIQLLAADQANYNPDFIEAIVQKPALAGRIGAFCTHCYADYTAEQFTQVRQSAEKFPKAHLWMTEYGDLEQTGDKEWFVSRVMTSRLFDALGANYQAALAWDAFDNYHDHDEFWTIYGLLRTGLRAFTPKKRYYAAKQVYRFVRPGFEQVHLSNPSDEVRLLAFASTDKRDLTIVGLSNSLRTLRLNLNVSGLAPEVLETKVNYYRTTETENCYGIGQIPFRGGNYPILGIDVGIPPDCIFTLTTLT